MTDWTAGDPRFLLAACADCGTLRYLPRKTCVSCRSRSVTLVESAGAGCCVAATIVHAGVADGPLGLALVELDEGTTVMGRAAGPLAPGDRARADFVRDGDALVPTFSRETRA